jgi:hypothetical protein
MSRRRMAILPVAFLLVAVLVAVFANATSESNAIRITVLDSETRSVTIGGSDVPKNCDQVNFDAYCNNSRSAIMTNTLLVQEGNEPPFHVSCTIDSKFSRCIPLPKGESFDARREKHGLVVYYVDDKGKTRKQLYTLIDADPARKGGPPAKAGVVATQSVPPPAAPRQGSAGPAPVASPTAQESGVKDQKVRCNFSSTPSGAEITLDGKYVGNTPSEIELGTGAHVVIFSMAGFGQWKRELTVLSGSELNVSAILQKEQP